jgi:hypothetical protein
MNVGFPSGSWPGSSGSPAPVRTGALFLVAAVPMLLAWPLAFRLAGREWELGSFRGGAAANLAFFACAVILGLFSFLRAHLVDRFALRLLGFAARSPVDGRAPFTYPGQGKS